MIVLLLGILLADVTNAWQDRPSGIQCTRTDVPEPILVVISMDGFAVRYLDLKMNPNLEAIGRQGARAEVTKPATQSFGSALVLERGFTLDVENIMRLLKLELSSSKNKLHIYSAYPSRTFVNHYTMATGLFAESHGIVDNNIWDPSISDSVEEVSRTPKLGFFKGEPIWSAYKRIRNGRVGCLNWIGCGINITGYQPDLNPPYDGKLTTEGRIDKVLEWLSLSPSTRPGLIIAYLGEPDNTGHFRKNDDEIPPILKQNDAAVDRLMKGISKLGLIDCVNVVFVSDHGMTDVTTHIYFDEHISVQGVVPVYGVIGRIYKNDTNRSLDSITKPFQCTKGDKYRLYQRPTLPVKFHYSSTPRVGDFIFDGNPGTTFYATKVDDWMLTGDHGYDPIHPSMRTIFFARGPSIRSGVVLQPFQTVEYFNLFSELLGIPFTHIPSNNGTLGLIDEIYSMPPPRITTVLTIPICSIIRSVNACSGCTQDNIFSIASRLSTCANSQYALSSISTLYPNRLSPYCSLRLCDIEIITAPSSSTVVAESLTPQSISSDKPTCSYETDDRPCGVSPTNSSLTMADILITTDNELTGISRGRVQLLTSFVNNFLKPLDELVKGYVKRYQRVNVITGTIYSTGDGSNNRLPSHIFRILYICPVWRDDGLGCVDPSQTRPLTFILPHIEEDINCLPLNDYFFAHSARVRDVEQLTGLQFFSDPYIVPHEISLKIRAHLPQMIWPV